MTETTEYGSGEPPAGWTKAAIGDLLGSGGVFIDGDWVESKDQDLNGDVRLIQLADVGDGVYRNRSARFLTSQKAAELRCTFLRAGDILIARMPDPLGRSCVFPGDRQAAVTVVDVCIVRPGDDGADPRWLMHSVNSPEFRASIAALQSGSTRKRISRGNLATLELPVPPLLEQHRIVARIEELLSQVDAGVAGLRDLQKKLKRYRAAVLKAACEGTLVPTEAELARAEGRDYEDAGALLARVLAERRSRWEADQLAKMRAQGKEPKDDRWKAKYEEPTAPDTSELSKLPEGWVWATIEQIVSSTPRSIQSGPFGSELLHSEFQTEGILALGIDNVLNGKFSLGRENRISADKYRSLERFTARPLDVLITVMATVGRCCVLPGNLEPAIITKHVYRMSVEQKIVNPFYLMYSILGGTDVRDQLFGKVQGQTRPGINGEILRNIYIPVPPPAEQKRIITEIERRLSVLDQTEAALRDNLKRADRLRQAVLRDAFAGKLVPQDPNDEPAAVLLERIRAERAGADAGRISRNGDGKAPRSTGGRSEGKAEKGLQEALPLLTEMETGR